MADAVQLWKKMAGDDSNGINLFFSLKVHDVI